jgi:UDP-glucose 4-epimerase
MDNKNVIVLGSSGFIGGQLVSWLRTQGYFVAGIDSVNERDLFLGLKKPNLFFQLNLPDKKLGQIIKEVGPVSIINASGPASVGDSILNPSMDFYGSVGVNFSVLETIRTVLPDAKYLMLSSAAVYGNPVSLPIRESHTLNPISPYGYHKVMVETLIEEYCNVYGLHTCSARIFSVYGPGLKKQILWDIYQKSGKDMPISLFGTGEESRDFIFVQDIAHAIQIILEKSNFTGNIYNIANGYEVSIKKISRLFVDALDFENKEIVFTGETKLGDPKRWHADIEQINKMGYSPSVSLEQGIYEYAKWVKKYGKKQ